MPSAFIVGGTGQIGRAVAHAMLAEGWEVRIASRSEPDGALPCARVRLSTDDPDFLQTAIADGTDVILDCVCFDGKDSDRLLTLKDRVGRIVAVSSASVYRDAQGRTLDEAIDCGPPQFPVPIPEDHPTVPPGPQTYSTRKVEMERRLLQQTNIPVTILRPCAIHGPYSKHAREWWFVKRLLDGRAQIPLAYGGRSRFQTTSTGEIARAVLHAAKGQAAPVVNVIDADAPTVAEIGQVIMAVMGRDARLVGLPDEPFPPTVGATPWSTEQPLVCASSLPPGQPYKETVPEAVEWLLAATRTQPWEKLLPQLAAYPRDHFDYDAEDAVLAR